MVVKHNPNLGESRRIYLKDKKSTKNQYSVKFRQHLHFKRFVGGLFFFSFFFFYIFYRVFCAFISVLNTLKLLHFDHLISVNTSLHFFRLREVDVICHIRKSETFVTHNR